MEHEPGGDVGRVDRTVSRTAAGMGLRLPKQGRRIMTTACVVGHNEHADYFSKHPTVGPEPATGAYRSPNRRSGPPPARATGAAG